MDLVRRCIPELFVNRYLMADADIDQRTILALRGNDPMTKHINTIVDYSLLWLLGVDYHNEGYGDREFLELVYPKMVSLWSFVMAGERNMAS